MFTALLCKTPIAAADDTLMLTDADRDSHSVDPNTETSQAHRAIMGRWRADVVRLVDYWLWYRATTIAWRTKAPLPHHRNFMQTKLTPEVLDAKGNHHCQLICGRAEEIFAEFNVILVDFAWMARICENSPAEWRSELLALIVDLKLHAASSYDRRIRQRTLTLPHLLAWIGDCGMNVVSAKRQDVCRKVLDTDLRQLDESTRRLRHVCNDDFQLGARTGTIGPILYSAIMLYRIYLTGNTQHNESFNKLLKDQADKSRTIGLPLVSGRACTRKELCLGSRDTQHKQAWKHVRESALALQRDLIDNFATGQTIMSEGDRWSDLPPTPGLPSDTELAQKMSVIQPTNTTQAGLWASGYNMMWPIGQSIRLDTQTTPDY